jgi:hypothetical protein
MRGQRFCKAEFAWESTVTLEPVGVGKRARCALRRGRLLVELGRASRALAPGVGEAPLDHDGEGQH